MKIIATTHIPETLTRLHGPPKKLFYAGNWELATSKQPKIAVVGSRQMSHYGRQVTADIVAKLVDWGVMIVSGLALGVDGLAHNTTTAAKGQTIAVLPSGLDKIYPRTHHALAQKILETDGLLLSEYDNSDQILNNQFIERNRIIAALADAVLIPEAAIASGSLHTARFALELGKPVLAVPGNIYSPMSQGTNNLLKSGAVVITEAIDVVRAIGYSPPPDQQQLFAGNEIQLEILKAIKSGKTNEIEIMRELQMEAPVFFEALTMLELDGRIATISPGHWI